MMDEEKGFSKMGARKKQLGYTTMKKKPNLKKEKRGLIWQDMYRGQINRSNLRK